VPDEEAVMASDLVLELSRVTRAGDSPESEFVREVRRQLGSKSYDGDSAEIRRLKGLIRRGEARAALKICGIEAGRIRFLDLPFYERGRYRQFQITEADVAAVAALLREVQPHQIFATGQLDDPSSVPAMCFEIIRRALTSLDVEAWVNDCRVWLYRGPDKEWETADIEMAVPLSPRELATKVQAIYHHKSQRSQSPVEPGLREAWQQADFRNRETARIYDQLGLAEYEAIEAFQRYLPWGAE
jgi:glucosamine-6-phosphate deaminase